MRKSTNRTSRSVRRSPRFQAMEARRLLAGDLQSDSPPAIVAQQDPSETPELLHNAERPTDVNDDGSTTALDALLVINQLFIHRLGFGLDLASGQELYLDVTNDNAVTALDALQVINVLVSGEEGMVDEGTEPEESEPDADSDAPEDQGDEQIDENDDLDDGRSGFRTGLRRDAFGSRLRRRS